MIGNWSAPAWPPKIARDLRHFKESWRPASRKRELFPDFPGGSACLQFPITNQQPKSFQEVAMKVFALVAAVLALANVSNAAAYNPKADRRSWKAMRAFFRDTEAEFMHGVASRDI
jgi:hypothetical protein